MHSQQYGSAEAEIARLRSGRLFSGYFVQDGRAEAEIDRIRAGRPQVDQSVNNIIRAAAQPSGSANPASQQPGSSLPGLKRPAQRYDGGYSSSSSSDSEGDRGEPAAKRQNMGRTRVPLGRAEDEALDHNQALQLSQPNQHDPPPPGAIDALNPPRGDGDTVMGGAGAGANWFDPYVLALPAPPNPLHHSARDLERWTHAHLDPPGNRVQKNPYLRALCHEIIPSWGGDGRPWQPFQVPPQ